MMHGSRDWTDYQVSATYDAAYVQSGRSWARASKV